MSPRPITLVTRAGEAASAAGDCVAVPALARFPADLREIMGLLPVADINAGLRAWLAQSAPFAEPERLVAGLFAADPFLDLAETRAALVAAGVTRVANFPTLQLVDGAAAAGLTAVGYDLRAELATLSRLRAAGFGCVAYVASFAGAELALAQGFATLAVHGGLPPVRGERALLARVAHLAAGTGATVLHHQREARRDTPQAIRP